MKNEDKINANNSEKIKIKTGNLVKTHLHLHFLNQFQKYLRLAIEIEE